MAAAVWLTARYTDLTVLDAHIVAAGDRFLLGITKINVYLFFDTNGRLLRHGIDEFHLMP
jgi:hypothetical protein